MKENNKNIIIDIYNNLILKDSLLNLLIWKQTMKFILDNNSKTLNE
jgi:hypothetical protein